LGGKLKEKFGEINDCTSENIDNERPENALLKIDLTMISVMLELTSNLE
jgi:hypothetical protein